MRASIVGSPVVLKSLSRVSDRDGAAGLIRFLGWLEDESTAWEAWYRERRKDLPDLGDMPMPWD